MLIMIHNLLQDHEMLYFIQHVQIYIIIIMLSTLRIKGRNFSGALRHVQNQEKTNVTYVEKCAILNI